MNSASCCSTIFGWFTLRLIELKSFLRSSQIDNKNMKPPNPNVKMQLTMRNKLVNITYCKKKANEYPIKLFVSNGNLPKQIKEIKLSTHR